MFLKTHYCNFIFFCCFGSLMPERIFKMRIAAEKQGESEPPPFGRQKTPCLPPARTPIPLLVMLRRVCLCNQRSLEPVPDHPLVPVLVVPDEPDEPLLRDTLETEFSHDLFDYSVLRSFFFFG